MSDDWTKRCAREWLEQMPSTSRFDYDVDELAAHIRRHAPKAGLQQCPHCCTTLFNAESDSESPEAARPGSREDTRASCHPTGSESTPPAGPEPLEAVVERFAQQWLMGSTREESHIVAMKAMGLAILSPWLAAREREWARPLLAGQEEIKGRVKALLRERDALRKALEPFAKILVGNLDYALEPWKGYIERARRALEKK